DLVQQGKVRYIGCSNYAAWEMTHGLAISQSLHMTPWVSVQPRWNLLEGLSDPTLLPACRALGVGIIPYRPLAGGVLTGKYRAGEEPPAGSRATRYENTRKLLTQDALSTVDRL